MQVATALVLLLAANTAFNGFPRLLSVMARNGHAPRLFLRLGDRLAFSNGTIALAIAAAVLFAVFAGRTDALIPLYAVGVFVAFTLSQVGMVVHWWRRRDEHWRKSMLLNGVGAALSAVVFVIAAVTKFSHGAWVALLLIALLVLVAWRIRRHYDSVRRALALYPLDGSAPNHPIVPTRLSARPATPHALPRAEDDESPDQLEHLAVVPIVRLDLASLRALAYAASLGQPVLAVHISPDDDEAARFKRYWAAWGDHLPLEVVDSPYRALVAPLACYIDALRTQRSELTLTVVLPELIVKHRWQQLLHNGTARRLRRALRRRPEWSSPPSRFTWRPEQGFTLSSTCAAPGGVRGVAGGTTPAATSGIGRLTGRRALTVIVSPWWEISSASPSVTVYVAWSRTSTCRRRPRKRRRNARRVSARAGAARSSGAVVVAQAAEAGHGAIQAPASDAMCSPSLVLCSRSARSISAASAK